MYDEVPKRRGPDRRPRQRPTQPGTSAAPPSAPRPRTNNSVNKPRGASVPVTDGGNGGDVIGTFGPSSRPTPPPRERTVDEARARAAAADPDVSLHHYQDSVIAQHHSFSHASSSPRSGEQQQQQQSVHSPSSGVAGFYPPVTTANSPPLSNTPAPNVPLHPSLYSNQPPQQQYQQDHQSQQARRAPPRVFHQRLASPHRDRSPSGAGSYSYAQSPAVAAPSPSSRGLSFILNPANDQTNYSPPTTTTSNPSHASSSQSQNGLHPIVTVAPQELTSASASSSPLSPTSAQTPLHPYPLHHSRPSREQYVDNGHHAMTSGSSKGYHPHSAPGSSHGPGSALPRVHRIDNAFVGQGMAVSFT